MQQQLFPFSSALFDLDTLATLLENYFELYGAAMKQQGLMENSEEFSEEYQLLQERYSELKNAADTALEEFLDFYEGYLSELQENEQESSPEQAETSEEKNAANEQAFAASSAVEKIEVLSSSSQEDVLSAPSVHTES